jgi:hypothetical protein
MTKKKRKRRKNPTGTSGLYTWPIAEVGAMRWTGSVTQSIVQRWQNM